jgi:hypothetical protein
MLYSELQSIYETVEKELSEVNKPVRRIRVSPLFYHALSAVIDTTSNPYFDGVTIIEDSRVETYEFQY